MWLIVVCVAYVIAAIVLFNWSVKSHAKQEYLDSGDISKHAVFFGLLWPIGSLIISIAYLMNMIDNLFKSLETWANK